MNKRFGIATLLASALFAAGCNSSDDDGDTTNGPDGTSSGDIFAIAARDADSDPARLDLSALRTQLDPLVGDGDSLEPLALEEDDTVTTALQRRRQSQGDVGQGM